VRRGSAAWCFLGYGGRGLLVTNVGIIVEKMHVFRTAVKADLSGTG